MISHNADDSPEEIRRKNGLNGRLLGDLKGTPVGTLIKAIEDAKQQHPHLSHADAIQKVRFDHPEYFR